MENLGISPLDLIVLGFLIFGALTGLVTGFVRGGLFLLSWAGAIIITIYSFSSIAIYSRKYIENELFADIAGGAIIFLLSLVILHLISQMLSNWIRSGSLNVIDRSFGLLAGIVITALALAVTSPAKSISAFLLENVSFKIVTVFIFKTSVVVDLISRILTWEYMECQIILCFFFN